MTATTTETTTKTTTLPIKEESAFVQVSHAVAQFEYDRTTHKYKDIFMGATNCLRDCVTDGRRRSFAFYIHTQTRYYKYIHIVIGAPGRT